MRAAAEMDEAAARRLGRDDHAEAICGGQTVGAAWAEAWLSSVA